MKARRRPPATSKRGGGGLRCGVGLFVKGGVEEAWKQAHHVLDLSDLQF